jgi:hypothetical protein
MSRIDGFSDVVFGFALTLLVVSLEVPKTYQELHETMRGFLPFAVSFVLLMTVWCGHYLFFRRFGLHDVGTIILNSMLLFVILFYVYPLKFLFGMLVSGWMGADNSSVFTSQHQTTELLVVYGLGFAVIYFLPAAMYVNALRQRDSLGLSLLELSLTRVYILDAVGVACVGLLSCILADTLPHRMSGLAGMACFLIGATKTFTGFRAGRKIRAAHARPLLRSQQSAKLSH